MMTYEAATSSYGSSKQTVTAYFEDRSKADSAIDRLAAAGIDRSAIRLIASDSGSVPGDTNTGTGGFWDSLSEFFMPDEDRHTYAEGLRRGGYLVTVTPSATVDYETALDILDDDGTIDIDERASSWRSEGWSGYDAASSGSSLMGSSGSTLTGSSTTAGYGKTSASGLEAGGEEVIPVMEEQLRVGKRDVSHGRVRVRSYVVETPVSEDVSLREESVTIQRRPVDRALAAGDRLFEDRTIEVEERAEEAVVAKETRVREEIVVNKQVGERTKTVSDTVRSTEVEIEDERVTGTRSSTSSVGSSSTRPKI